MPILSRCRDMLASSLLLASTLLAQDFDATWVEEIYPGGEAPEGERWILCRVVDKFTSQPIPNAELLLIQEMDHAAGGPIEAWREVSDDDGFLSVRVDKGAVEYEPWNWLCVRAPGYCQFMRMTWLGDEVIELTPSVAIPVQVRDWRDDPVEGALVGFCAGCGHTPDLVHGRTGKNGLVTLPGIDLFQGITDFYVVHPDLELGYDDPGWTPGRQPMVMRLGPGLPHSGVVVDHEGVPVAGALVGMSEVHRGPWARTRGDGSFLVAGLESETDLYVQHDRRKYIFACVDTQGLRLQLPKPTDEPTVVVEVPRELKVRQELLADQRQELYERRKAAWPKVTVRTVGMPEDGSVTLRTKRERFDLDDLIATGGKVAIPDEDFVWHLSGDGDGERILEGDREQALRDGLVRLHWYRDTVIEGRMVDEDGAPITAAVRVESLHASRDQEPLVDALFEGGISLPVRLEGVHMLVVRERYSGGERRIPIDIPPRGDDVFVDVGTIVVRERSPLALLGDDGKPLLAAQVKMHRLGFHGWDLECDNGHWWVPDLREGDVIEVQAERDPPKGVEVDKLVDVRSRFRVEGDGPWTFRLHRGEILIDIDAEGVDVGVTVGRHFLSVDEPTLLRGLEPGMHKMFVSAKGRQSAIVDVEVPETGHANVKMALPPQ